jgi:hypothetical protein
MSSFQKVKAIRLKGRAYTKFRREVHDRAGGHCERCGRYAPLLVDGVFDVFTCGHVAHKRSVGAGGSDTMDNVRWECYNCHIGLEHIKGDRG